MNYSDAVGWFDHALDRLGKVCHDDIDAIDAAFDEGHNARLGLARGDMTIGDAEPVMDFLEDVINGQIMVAFFDDLPESGGMSNG